MKNISYALAFCAVFAMASCADEIKEADRYEYMETVPVHRAVLIEDFTGQKCPNCPATIETIEENVEKYGEEAIISVAVHSGPLGFAGSSKFEGLKTDTGDEYYSYWGCDHQPMILVNRRGGPADFPVWVNTMRAELQKAPEAEIVLSSVWNAESRTLGIEAEVAALRGFEGSLSLWLVEDGIVTIQTMPDGTNNNEFVHNHVFRCAVNGTWGDALSMAQGQVETKEYTYVMPEKWKADKVSIVAFVYDANGVLNVIKRKVM